MAASNICPGRLDLWRDSLTIRGYEWFVYAWSAGVCALWAGVAKPFSFEYQPSNALQWLAVWPAWLDLQVRLLLSTTAYWNPILEPSIIGAIGGCAVAYLLLTVSHLRDSS